MVMPADDVGMSYERRQWWVQTALKAAGPQQETAAHAGAAGGLGAQRAPPAISLRSFGTMQH